jgi:flavin reductase (DIM6/NTAB) family NADH-FMN oxidoreductase RutF
VRVEFDPDSGSPYAFYPLLTSLIVPRPIAWVATLSAGGVANLAPHSFFTVACVVPPVIQFTSVGRKDSLRNIEATGEFTVSVTPERLFEEVNATATDFPQNVDEFAAVGLDAEASRRVAPPRVAQSPAVFECRLQDTISFGDSFVVFGRVLLAAVDEDAIGDNGLPAIGALRPLARLGADEWSTIGEVREITRIANADWPGHYDGARTD